MKLLLDTHTLLWFQSDDPKLSATAKLARGSGQRTVALAHQFGGDRPQESPGQAPFAGAIRHTLSRISACGRHSPIAVGAAAHRAANHAGAAPQRPIRPPDRGNRVGRGAEARISRSAFRRLRADKIVVSRLFSRTTAKVVTPPSEGRVGKPSGRAARLSAR